jgi:hypothetical protein
MQSIPAATFTMLADARSVTLSTFCIDRTEVTVGAYKACVNAGACTAPAPGNWGASDRNQHPINAVDWFQADAYCKWSGKRLPSEEEWEHAASGNSPRSYPWGNEPADGRVCIGAGTCPVGSYPGGDSPFGVKDMAGNVWEWTSSGSAAHRIIRGGPFYGDASAQRIAVRITDADSAHGTDSASGFRCARGEPPALAATKGCDSTSTSVMPKRPSNVPSSWKNVGRLEVHVRGEPDKKTDFTTYDVRDPAGVVVMTRSFKEMVKQDGDTGDMTFRTFLAQGICRLGGVAGVGPVGQNDRQLDEQLRATGNATLVFELLAPPQEDEGGDLDRVCRKPSAGPATDDPQTRAAHEYLAAKDELRFLSSRKWRTWLGKVENANGAAELARVGDAFVAATREAGKPSCFFPTAVKELAATSAR